MHSRPCFVASSEDHRTSGAKSNNTVLLSWENAGVKAVENKGACVAVSNSRANKLTFEECGYELGMRWSSRASTVERTQEQTYGIFLRFVGNIGYDNVVLVNGSISHLLSWFSTFFSECPHFWRWNQRRSDAIQGVFEIVNRSGLWQLGEDRMRN
jgi:hypothetical protein